MFKQMIFLTIADFTCKLDLTTFLMYTLLLNTFLTIFFCM